MKKLFAVLLTTLMLFSLFQGALRENVVKAVDYSPEDFVGLWVNDNENTPGITWFIIRIEGDTFIVQAFGKCYPTDCDWGTSTTKASDASDGILELTWNFTFKVTKLNIRLTDKDKVEVVSKNHYTDNSGRQDYERKEFFTKTKETSETYKWVPINNGLYGGYIKSIAIDPKNTNTIYVGTWRGGIFKSMDGGSSWSAINIGFTAADIRFLVIDPTNTQVVYAGTNGGMFKSTNGGSSWSAINNGLTSTSIRSIAIDPTNTQVVYAGTNGGMFKSTNGGSSWSAINNGLIYISIYSLAIDPKNTNIIYVGTWNGGVFKSTNGGSFWSAINNGLRKTNLCIAFLVVDATNTETIYIAVNSYGVFKSTDSGGNWSEINTGLTNDLVNWLAIDPTNRQVIYAGTGGGFFKSVDTGISWSKTSNLLTNISIYSLAIDQTNSKVIYAGTELDGIYKSMDGGMNWSHNWITTNSVESIAIDPNNAQVIYTGTNGLGVFKSIDGGLNWTQIDFGLPDFYPVVESLAIDPTNTQVVYAGTFDGGAFKTTNSGASWTQINKGLTNEVSVYSIVIHPTNTQTVYSGTNNGVFKSTNGGETWTQMDFGLPDFYPVVESLAIDPTNTQVVYAGTFDGGVFKTTNSGASWTQINKGLTEINISSLVINPKNAQIIYAGTNSRGVFKSTNGGLSWNEMNNGLTNKNIITLAIDPTNTQVVYAGTWGGGIFKYVIPPPSSPQNLTINTSTNSITLTWSPSTQGTYPLAGYAVYRGTASGAEDTTPIAKVDAPITTYTDTNVSFDTTYYYYVKAYDNQDPANYSEASNEVSDKIVDTTPPDISISRPMDNSTLETDSVVVSGKATDSQSGIYKVTVKGNEVSVSSDGSFSMSISLSEGLNRITVVVIDMAGNQTTKTVNITYKKPVRLTTIILQIGNTTFTVNGETRTLDSPPIIKNNRTLLPIRAVVEALGGTVGWDATERKVTVSLGSKTLELWIGKSTAKVNGVDTPIDSANSKVVPEIINSRTMLPLRFVAESLGCDVQWDGTAKTITITYQQ